MRHDVHAARSRLARDKLVNRCGFSRGERNAVADGPKVRYAGCRSDFGLIERRAGAGAERVCTGTSSSALPDPQIQSYRVEMHVNCGPGDHPVVFDVCNADLALQTWQAYLRSMLTGGFFLDGECAIAL